MASLEENLKTVVRIFRRECHRILESERTTIHGADGMLIILQLVMAELNKAETGEFAVALSDVISAWKHLLWDKSQMPQDGAPRPQKYDFIRKEYDSFLRRTNTLDLIDVLGMYEQLKGDQDPKNPLSSVQLLHYLSGDMEIFEEESIPPCPTTPSSRPNQCSLQGLRRLFCSYLGLLVNTKNDLALAHALDLPSRGLGRAAFTDLKHAARTNSTSLFLAATSFVRAIQLGGKGYAPPDADPLRKHIKGLSDFVHFTDRLEELLGEIPDPSEAGARIVSSVRAALLKGRSGGAPGGGAVEEVALRLERSIARIHAAQKQAACSSGISPARPRAYAINHATAYGGREAVKLLVALLDEEALAPPCRNKATLLSGDLDPFNGAEETSILTLFRSPEAPTGSSPKPLQLRVQEQLNQAQSMVRFPHLLHHPSLHRNAIKPTAPLVKRKAVRSQFACTYRDDDPPINRVLEFPSASQAPTCVQPAPKRAAVPGGEEGAEPKMDAVTAAKAGAVQRPALGQRCANPRGARDPASRKGSARAAPQAGSKARKRKEVDGSDDVENCPPPKRGPTAKARNAAPPTGTGTTARSSNAAKKRKLVAGQTTLSGFFRL